MAATVTTIMIAARTSDGPSKLPRRIPPRLRSATLDYDFNNITVPQTPHEISHRVPAPSHRHGTPSDPSQLEGETSPLPVQCDHSNVSLCNDCWKGYPQSLFPNWTPAQQRRSRISKIVERLTDTCIIHYVDVDNLGRFYAPENDVVVTHQRQDNLWQLMMTARPQATRLRAMFLDNLSGPVLRMIGTKYNIEPFFFSSSLGWIPSRYQEDVVDATNITITLTFVHTTLNPITAPDSPTTSFATASTMSRLQHPPSDQVIDTQGPLAIRSSDHIIMPDLLALHMVRQPGNSTIVSYHLGSHSHAQLSPQFSPEIHEHHARTTSASALHSRLVAAGHSVYWSNIFAEHDDPTFVFLSLLWYALYAWDEVLEVLYAHICWLELRVIITNDIALTQELHVIQAHLVHYASLLEEFRKSVVFVRDTPYPALADPERYTDEKRQASEAALSKECSKLLDEIARLESARRMQGRRLKNIMDLGFSIVNIEDSKRTAKLTEATLRDGEAMKQIAYVSMIFLPASLAVHVFSMNVVEINPDGGLETLPHYFAVALPLTVFTIWAVVAAQFRPNMMAERGLVWGTLGRAGWPLIMASELWRDWRTQRRQGSQPEDQKSGYM
ncbi:hypothetical protein H0H81_004898 [Sphagnurus paluster]|uniref:Uncharacterized protein n=1 Tax=Sphagnurus paluster TaxID=117069 RepID=A0A9P7FYE5_9AGAR|nr:hypothetical protein H0H81_004898 [Sphagnurus paluster]